MPLPAAPVTSPAALRTRLATPLATCRHSDEGCRYIHASSQGTQARSVGASQGQAGPSVTPTRGQQWGGKGSKDWRGLPRRGIGYRYGYIVGGEGCPRGGRQVPSLMMVLL